MSRYRANPSSDLVTFLAGAVRRRASPFAVVEAVLELVDRKESPAALGGAVLTFDATLAGEVRDALERRTTPVARYFQAMVPREASDAELESSWRSAAHALSKFAQFTEVPRAAALERLRPLSTDEAVVRATQAALATADPHDVAINRWFVPLLMLEGSEPSIDALLPHLDAALSGARPVLSMFKPLVGLAAKTPAMTSFITQLAKAAGRRQTLKRG